VRCVESEREERVRREEVIRGEEGRGGGERNRIQKE
jgi:hypothetical protein